MKLSDGEKLILVMLSDIHRHLKIDGEVDPDFVVSAVTGGHTWALGWQYHGIFNDEEDDPAVVTETCEILDMYRVLEQSYNKLSPADRKRVKAEAAPFDDVEFGGFDANREPHYHVTRVLVEELDRYSELKGRELNSHAPTIESARRMRKTIEPMLKGLGAKNLSADQIITVLKAQEHR